MEFVRFIGQDFKHFMGFVVILIIMVSPFLTNKDKEEDIDE